MTHRTGPAFRGEARPLTLKLAGGLVGSCLAAGLGIALLASPRVPAPPTQDRVFASADTLAAREPGESSADFLERIALSHVASLKAPPESEAVAEPAAPAPRPSPRRPERAHAAKARVAAAGAEAQPPAQPPLDPAAAPGRPKDAAPASAELDWMHPIQSGMRLIAGLDHVVAASKARIAEGVATVGASVSGALASLGKTPEK